jgi:hypothetical protein
VAREVEAALDQCRQRRKMEKGRSLVGRLEGQMANGSERE